MNITQENLRSFKTFHGDGTPSIIGFECIRTGQKVGVWKFYHENGNLALIGHYKDGLEDGEHRSYYENGQLKIIFFHENNMRVGEWTFYAENGLLEKIEFYKNGFLTKIEHSASTRLMEMSDTYNVSITL
tara:strand:- start:540 stop:929 length:390 start_codon:yes stop_codon:yes gene_type:complete